MSEDVSHHHQAEKQFFPLNTGGPLLEGHGLIRSDIILLIIPPKFCISTQQLCDVTVVLIDID
jgi:hypothetical protein